MPLAPAAALVAAVVLVHVGLSLEEQAFLRAHSGGATEPTPRFVGNCWFAVDEKGNLVGGD